MKYIAPEVISGEKYDRMADFWSLGIILYRMLTGQLPHPTNVNRKIPHFIVNYKIPIEGPYFSKHSKDLLEKLLERKPSKRLGANGIGEIKNHRFFKNVNWKKLKPPFIPGAKIPNFGKSISRSLTTSKTLFNPIS